MRHWGNGITLALFVTTIGLGGCTLPQPPPPGQTPTTEVRPGAPKPAEPAPTTEGRPVAAKAAGSPESPQERSRVYVANESSNSVTVIDARTFEVLATIDARNHATHDLALSRDGHLLLATNLASGRLSLIDTDAMETIGSVYTGERAHVVAFTNDDQQAWVANIAEDNVSILDVRSRRILGTIPTGKGPTGLTFSRDGRFAYVSNQGDKTVAVVDTATLVVVKSIPVGTNPHFLILGPDGRIWGCNTGSNDVYIIDAGTQDVVGSFQVGPAPQQIAFGYKGLQGPLAYVTVAGFNKVLVLGGSATNLRVMEEIEVGDGPNGIWANPQGTRLFVVHERSNELWVIDTGTSRVIARVPVGRKPIRVVVSK